MGFQAKSRFIVGCAVSKENQYKSRLNSVAHRRAFGDEFRGRAIAGHAQAGSTVTGVVRVFLLNVRRSPGASHLAQLWLATQGESDVIARIGPSSSAGKPFTGASRRPAHFPAYPP